MEDDIHNYLSTAMFRGTPCNCKYFARCLYIYNFLWSYFTNFTPLKYFVCFVPINVKSAEPSDTSYFWSCDCED